MLRLTYNTCIGVSLYITQIDIFIYKREENSDNGWENLQTSYKLENKRTTKTLNNVE